MSAAAFVTDVRLPASAVAVPFVIAGLGTLLSVGGVFLVTAREGADQEALLAALSRGVNSSALGIALLSLPALLWMGAPDPWGIWGAVIAGLATDMVIGRATEYATSATYKPTRLIASAAESGPATAIISGLGAGMLSTTVPVLAVAVGTLLAFFCGAGFSFDNVIQGLYGVGIAAVRMLSTLGITLASDAYGPIADNAGGNAEMSGSGPEVRARTDALDALGNTTAATGKGFAIGSAALTALALVASYLEVVRIEMIRAGKTHCSSRTEYRSISRARRLRISWPTSMSRCSTLWFSFHCCWARWWLLCSAASPCRQ
ncbi:MAG: K(+)-stimulated pyrophosphate-energized sodium pump [Halieaceae bacterium]|jgi:K(+)-stimulated pyrophosphate-energized sodium pump